MVRQLESVRKGGTSFGFPEGEPPNGPRTSSISAPFDSKKKPSNQQLLKEAFLSALHNLGKSVEKQTLTQLEENGIDLLDPSASELDTKKLHHIMKETIGPGADVVIEDTWKYIKANRKVIGKPLVSEKIRFSEGHSIL